MPAQFGRDISRRVLAGIGLQPVILLSVALLAAGCDGNSPLAFLKPKPAAQQAETTNKPASTGAPERKTAAKTETVKPSGEPQPGTGEKTARTGPAKPELAKTGSRKTEPKKEKTLSPEHLATAPLSPTDRLEPGFWIQLASHFRKESSEAAWKTLSAKYGGLLGGEAHVVKRFDLGERGRYYRLLIGPYEVRQTAWEKCARLREAKLACFVVTRRGRARSGPVAGTPKSVEPKPPATAFPAAAVKPRNRATSRKTGLASTPALVKPALTPRGKAAARKNRAADLPFQRRDSIPGITK